ncbi:hypothetical protein BN1263400027 [Stenotrophomonas indicatrix]|nr:hypothetical protein BN1263400027 [Stenotrophomonas indicatrix]
MEQLTMNTYDHLVCVDEDAQELVVFRVGQMGRGPCSPGWRFRRLRDGLPSCRILRKRSARTC